LQNDRIHRFEILHQEQEEEIEEEEEEEEMGEKSD
jgi:hypothetical protein